MSKIDKNLPFNFPSKKPLNVEFSALDLSTDAGLLLIKQAETNLQICQGITNCLDEKREQHKIRHPLSQLISQRIYQIVAGYVEEE